MSGPEEPKAAPAGRSLYLAASGVAQLCALVRYTALARVLGPQELGLAAILVLTNQFLESVSDTGADRFLIQDRDGDTDRIQRMVQLVYVARGVLTALGLVLLATPIAGIYRTPALGFGLVVMAAAPLVGGWLHLDLRRVQRRSDFSSEGVGLIASEVLSLGVTVWLAISTRSFIGVAVGMIARSAILVAVSHLRAVRPYRLGYSAGDARRLAAFAAPLILNGLLLFVANQGDRIVISNQIGVSELGRYSAVMLLIFSPMAAIQRFLASTNLPLIAAARTKPQVLDATIRSMASTVTLVCAGVCAGFAVAAPVAVSVLYGHRFQFPLLTLGLIGAHQTARVMRLWPITSALALGRSDIVLANTLASLTGWGFALAAALTLHGLNGLVLGFLAGEVTSFAVSAVMVNRATGRPSMTGFAGYGRFGVLCGTTIGGLGAVDRGAPAAALGLGLAAAASFAGLLWAERVALRALISRLAAATGRFALTSRVSG